MSKDVNLKIEVVAPKATESLGERYDRLIRENGSYGKFASGGMIDPTILESYNARPWQSVHGRTIPLLNARPWQSVHGRTIPLLNVPAAPAEPSPEPESASVQMLRKLLVERRREKVEAESHKKSSLQEIADLEKGIVSVRASVDANDRTITAADAAIAETLSDIEKLGGRSE